MNADLLRIRNSKLFKKLPDRAFDRIADLIKVRAFESGDEVLNFDAGTDFSQSYGYVISGQVLFLDDKSKPIGIATKDEFFLGRPFSLNQSPVKKMLSTHESTFVVFVPRDVIRLLAQASEQFSDMIEDIYDSIFERAKSLQADSKGFEKVQEWLKHPESSKTIATWVDQIEKQRADAEARKAKAKQARKKIIILWVVGVSLCLLSGLEALARFLHWNFSFTYLVNPNWKIDAYKPGSNFNIGLGIVGFTLVLLTNMHTVVRWGIRKKKWKVNFQFSQELHMFFGFLGFLFILLHSSFRISGANVANFGVVTLIIVVASGLFGQFISAQIPKSIRGEMLKLDQLKEEQDKLREKATLLMNDQAMYRTSIGLLSQSEPQSAMGSFFLAPLFWFKARKLRQTLEQLGLATDNAKLASRFVMDELRLHRKIKFLEISNIFFKRWMMVHKPLGYLAYAFAILHVLIVTVLA